MNALRVLCLCGSRGRTFYNARLLHYLRTRATGRCALELLAPEEHELPLFDDEAPVDAALLTRLRVLHGRLRSADALIVASPEHNGLPPPHLTNLVAWVSRVPRLDPRLDSAFLDRPSLVCSASADASGAALGSAQLRTLLGHVGCVVAPDAVRLPHAQRAWSEAGYSFDPYFAAEVDHTLWRFLDLATTLAPRLRPQADDAGHDDERSDSQLALASF
jgi:chromate reductase